MCGQPADWWTIKDTTLCLLCIDFKEWLYSVQGLNQQECHGLNHSPLANSAYNHSPFTSATEKNM
jgi:hypothetical protein